MIPIATDRSTITLESCAGSHELIDDSLAAVFRDDDSLPRVTGMTIWIGRNALMIPRIGFSSLAVGLIGLALALTPQLAEARGHGGFHGGGFHGGGFRGGFYGGGFGRGFYGGGFGRGFYGGGIYAGRGFYGGYRGFYPRYYGGYYGGFYPRYYGSYYMSPGYYGAGYGGSGYGGGYAPNYGNCSCGTYGLNNGGYVMTSPGGIPGRLSTNPALPVNFGASNPRLAYYLKNNPYNTPRIPAATLVSNGNSAPAGNPPVESSYARYFPAVLTERSVALPPPAPGL
jgi:hypothetical protein